MGLIEENEGTSKPDPKKLVRPPLKNMADYQRLKLDKLMKNIHKPVVIPERPKERDSPAVPDFVRNVMGSSAGAGSGEFHVYRHLRRKEYARQKYMQIRAEKERKDEEYREKLIENQKLAEERTAKKRAKRLKKKQSRKNKKPKLEKSPLTSQDIDESSESEDDIPAEIESNETKHTIENQNENQIEEKKVEASNSDIVPEHTDQSISESNKEDSN